MNYFWWFYFVIFLLESVSIRYKILKNMCACYTRMECLAIPCYSNRRCFINTRWIFTISSTLTQYHPRYVLVQGNQFRRPTRIMLQVTYLARARSRAAYYLWVSGRMLKVKLIGILYFTRYTYFDSCSSVRQTEK